MATIDVGPGATNRAGNMAAGGYTLVDENNAANASGRLAYFEIFAYTNMAGVKVATFSKSGTTFTARDVATIGSVESGSKQTFSIDIAVEAGDYLGIFYSNGRVEWDTSGYEGVWYTLGDKTASSAVFAEYSGCAISIYAYGATGDEEFGSVSVGVGASVAPNGDALFKGLSALSAAASLALVGGRDRPGSAAIAASASIGLDELRIRPGACATNIVAALSILGDKNLTEALASIGVIASLSPNGDVILSGAAAVEIAAALVMLGAQVLDADASITISTSANVHAGEYIWAAIAIVAAMSLSGLAYNVQSGRVTITGVGDLALVATSYVAQVFGYSGTLSPGDVLVIDCDQKTVELNGANAVRYMTGKFPLLYSGTNEVRWADDEAARTIAFDEDHDPRYL